MPIAANVLKPQQAAADVPGTDVNFLQLVGKKCHDLKSITHDFSDVNSHMGYGSRCHQDDTTDNIGGKEPGWEEALQDSLGCSGDMFYRYSFKDLNDSSVTTQQRWYTHVGAYKACFSKAQTMFNNMTNPSGQCVLAVDESQHFKNCRADVHNLHVALGCSTHMMKLSNQRDSNGNRYHTVDPNDPNVKNCLQRINDVGKIRLYVPIPGPNVNSKQLDKPISDPSITSDTTDPGGVAGGDINNDGPACEYSANALSWIICPVVDLLELAIETTDDIINDQLTIPQNDIFCTDQDTCNDYYKAWSSFRNISLGLLAIAGLITVISQAIGMEILDAYTIRKILPRILVAAIGITLSWTLMSFAVTLANNLGYGVRDLILSPFHGVLESSHIGFSGSVGGLIGGFAAFVLGGIAAVAAIGILLSYLATAGLAVLIAIAVLVLRQIVIIILMILSPVAFIAYVLPNTQRVFKLWWESFSKALLMFPLIAAFIAAGRVFAAISLDGSQSLFTQLTALVAYFGPYFAIPLTFRMSGGIMSGVGNFVQRAGQPVGGMLQGYRSNKAKERIAAGKAGTLFEPKRWIPGSTAASGAINEAAKGIGLGWKGRYGLGQRGKEARGGALLTAAGELGKDPRMQSIGGYNDANRILAEGMGSERRGREALFKHLTKDGGDDGKTFLSPEEAQAKVDKAAKAAKTAGGFTRTHGLAALHSMARDGTAIRDTDDLARMAALAGAGDRNATFTTAADLAKTSGQAGRPDLAAASEPIGELAFAHSDSTFGGKLYSSGGREKAEEDMDKLQYAAWESGAGGESAYSVLNSGKSRSVRFPAQYAMGVVKNKRGTYSQEQRQQAAAFLTHTQQGIDSGYGKPNNIKQFRDIMGTPENANALQEFMSQPAQVQEQTQTVRVSDRQPQVETRTVQGTNADIVGGLVSRRGSMSQDQMAAEAASHQDQAQAEEQNQNQEQG